MSITSHLLAAILVSVAAAPEESFKTITDRGDWGDYEAFPDVCRVADGRLLAVFYAGNDHLSQPTAATPKGGRICLMRSGDSGATWSRAQTLVDLDGDDRDPSLLATRKGILICSFMKFYGRREVPRSHVVWVTRSLDAGRTWEEPKPVASGFSTMATSSPVVELADGTLLMPVFVRDTASRYPVDEPGRRDRALVLRATDDGRSWGSPVFVDPEPAGHLQEPALVEIGPRRLLCVMRPGMTRSFSGDDGRTWSKPERLAERGDAPYLLRARSGMLLCAFRSKAPDATRLILSGDGGRTWSPSVRIDDCPGAYPSMVELADGRILCIYYEEGRSSSIRQTVFRVTPAAPFIRPEPAAANNPPR
jgi:sialidase-1